MEQVKKTAAGSMPVLRYQTLFGSQSKTENPENRVDSRGFFVSCIN